MMHVTEHPGRLLLEYMIVNLPRRPDSTKSNPNGTETYNNHCSFVNQATNELK